MVKRGITIVYWRDVVTKVVTQDWLKKKILKTKTVQQKCYISLCEGIVCKVLFYQPCRLHGSGRELRVLGGHRRMLRQSRIHAPKLPGQLRTLRRRYYVPTLWGSRVANCRKKSHKWRQKKADKSGNFTKTVVWDLFTSWHQDFWRSVKRNASNLALLPWKTYNSLAGSQDASTPDEKPHVIRKKKSSFPSSKCQVASSSPERRSPSLATTIGCIRWATSRESSSW